MSLKVSLFFTEGPEGWSETYYTNDSNVLTFQPTPDSYKFFNTPVGQLVSARRALMVTEANIIYIRVTDLGTPTVPKVGRNAITTYVDGQYQDGTYPSAQGTEVFSSLLVKMGADPTVNRRVFLGGIPESVITPPQSYTPSSNFTRVFQAFANLMNGGTNGGRYILRSRPAVAPNQLGIITFVTSADGLSATVHTSFMNAGVRNSVPVIIRGMKAPRGWNGVHSAAITNDDVTAGTTFIIRLRKPGITVPAYGGLGAGQLATAQLYVSRETPILTVQPEKIVSRRRGRPFGVSRGRR